MLAGSRRRGAVALPWQWLWFWTLWGDANITGAQKAGLSISQAQVKGNSPPSSGERKFFDHSWTCHAPLMGEPPGCPICFGSQPSFSLWAGNTMTQRLQGPETPSGALGHREGDGRVCRGRVPVPPSVPHVPSPVSSTHAPASAPSTDLPQRIKGSGLFS